MSERIYLLVPAEEHEKAQQAGAAWDPQQLRFFIRADQDPTPLLDWLPVDELEDEEVPELCAAPPVCVAETTALCRHCGATSPVIALVAEKFAGVAEGEPDFLMGKGSAAQNELGDGLMLGERFGSDSFDDEEADEEFDDTGLYQHSGGLMRFHEVRRLPAEVADLLCRHYPFYRRKSFRKAPMAPDGGAFFLNFCTTCGEAFGEPELHSEPGRGFYLFSAAEAARVVLRELPLGGPLLLEATFSRVAPDFLCAHARREPFPPKTESAED